MESLAQEQIVANVLAQSDTKAVTELGEERMACTLLVSVFHNMWANEFVWYLYLSYSPCVLDTLRKPEIAGFTTASNFGRMHRAQTAGKSLCESSKYEVRKRGFLGFFDVFCKFWHKGVLHFAKVLEIEWTFGRCV